MRDAKMPVPEPQSAGAILMVRPSRFAFNPETAASNGFQSSAAQDAETSLAALREFDGVAEGLAQAGVEVIVAEDSAAPLKPDAVFPNNWVSFHDEGVAVLYPLLAPNRRAERREDIVALVAARGGFRILRTVDLSHREDENKFLEGTGSLVLDRRHHLAYAALSPRTDLDVLGEFAQQMDYDLVAFDTADARGRAVYHTNVVMSIGSEFAVLCGAALGSPASRQAVTAKLSATGHEVIDITAAQMQCFAGNLLELAPSRGRVIALSSTALRSFDAAQRGALERCGTLLAFDIPVIERCGGGGVRCMLAEIHLPKRPRHD